MAQHIQYVTDDADRNTYLQKKEETTQLMIIRTNLYYFLYIVSHMQYEGRIWNRLVNNLELSSACLLPGYYASEILKHSFYRLALNFVSRIYILKTQRKMQKTLN
jgi:hypothetical protein